MRYFSNYRLFLICFFNPGSIDPDQPKHAAQANPDRQVTSCRGFLFQEFITLYLYPRPETECVNPD